MPFFFSFFTLLASPLHSFVLTCNLFYIWILFYSIPSVSFSPCLCERRRRKRGKRGREKLSSHLKELEKRSNWKESKEERAQSIQILTLNRTICLFLPLPRLGDCDAEDWCCLLTNSTVICSFFFSSSPPANFFLFSLSPSLSFISCLVIWKANTCVPFCGRVKAFDFCNFFPERNGLRGRKLVLPANRTVSF